MQQVLAAYFTKCWQLLEGPFYWNAALPGCILLMLAVAGGLILLECSYCCMLILLMLAITGGLILLECSCCCTLIFTNAGNCWWANFTGMQLLLLKSVMECETCEYHSEGILPLFCMSLHQYFEFLWNSF